MEDEEKRRERERDALANARQVCRELVRRSADVNACNDVGWTAVMYAAWKCHPEARVCSAEGFSPGHTHTLGRRKQSETSKSGALALCSL